MGYPLNSNCTFFYIQGTGYFISPVSAATGIPPGMALSGGSITGSPTTLGIIDGTIDDGSGSLPWRSIVCTGAHAPTVDAPSLLWSITIGVSSPVVMTGSVAFDGTPPLSWSKHSAIIPLICAAATENLPPGLTINSDGTVTGTPTALGTYTCQIALVDAGFNINDGVKNLIIQVVAAAALSISCNSPPGGVVGSAYSHTILASGGTPPYSFAITSGSLPTGLSLNSSTGVISGTPTVGGTYSFQVTVTDSLSATAAASCSIAISSASGVGNIYKTFYQ